MKVNLHPIRLIFGTIDAAAGDRTGGTDAREKMHTAATIACVAFANAFLFRGALPQR